MLDERSVGEEGVLGVFFCINAHAAYICHSSFRGVVEKLVLFGGSGCHHE